METHITHEIQRDIFWKKEEFIYPTTQQFDSKVHSKKLIHMYTKTHVKEGLQRCIKYWIQSKCPKTREKIKN